MSLIALAVGHFCFYEDANEFTACLRECAHSGGAAAADLGEPSAPALQLPSVNATGASPVSHGVSPCTAFFRPWRCCRFLRKD